MEEIFGRESEKGKLERLIKSAKPELLAVYGRRRVGKTFLMREYFRNRGIFFELTGVYKGNTADQLRRFPEAFYEAFPSQKEINIPKDWKEAFDILRERISQEPQEQKIILFLDELPWLAAKRPELLMSLEHAWNRYFSRKPNVIMILCGSAASWMIKKIINNSGGLYGRLTEKIHLQPFTLLETEKYLAVRGIHLERKQLVEVYMSIGGIPKYLDHILKGMSASQIIQTLCFSPGGFLNTEFRSLFEALFGSHKHHIAVIEALAASPQGLTYKQLANSTQLTSGGQLSDIIDDLEASGFIGVVPFYGRKKQTERYRIIDEYTLFYLAWIKDALFYQERPITANYWQSVQQSQKYNVWAGYAFENICFKHITSIIEALKISVVARSASYWAHHSKPGGDIPGAQIDLIIDRADRTMSLCEMKFANAPYIVTKDYALKMNQKRSTFQALSKTKKTLFNILIAPYGAVENASYHSAFDQHLTLEALFHPV
ncbi:MAG: ATP-binding protein [Chlamydiales bacterium]|nr:ATP-binding protein [Chlamydiales bacterium]